jgi:hypothetical protein
VTREQLAEGRPIAPVAAVQNRFGVLDQDDAALVDECAHASIAFMPFFALGGGRAPLAGDKLMQVAERHSATPFQVAIAWGLTRSPTIVQIPDTSSLAHLTENMAASRLILDAADMTLLSQCRCSFPGSESEHEVGEAGDGCLHVGWWQVPRGCRRGVRDGGESDCAGTAQGGRGLGDKRAGGRIRAERIERSTDQVILCGWASASDYQADQPSATRPANAAHRRWIA